MLNFSWQQLTSYSPLSGSPITRDSAAMIPSESPSRRWPTVADSLASRKLRLLLATALIISLFLAYHRYGAPAGLPTEWAEGNSASQQPPAPASGTTGNTGVDVDWSRFAYTQYVTDSDYLCNSVMLFERLQHLESRADRVMMYPSHMLDPTAASSPTSRDARLLIKARDEYNVKLVPIEVQRRDGADRTWAESFTKLLAFNQTQYERVLSLDSDSVVLQSMDELFLLPPCPMAMPRAYWLYPDTKILSSQVMLLQPSTTEFDRVMDAVSTSARGDYDMEIVNTLYGDSALVLPHRPYDALTAEFRAAPDRHGYYLGSETEEWDPVAAFNEVKFLHFSDWPTPKPWLSTPESTKLKMQPECHMRNGVESCIERDMWNGFYDDFRQRRKRVCENLPAERLRR